jgi:hypothetical protein
MDMCWQGLALSIEFLNQGRVVFLYKLVEQFCTAMGWGMIHKLTWRFTG